MNKRFKTWFFHTKRSGEKILDFRFSDFFLVFGHCFGLGTPIFWLDLLLEQPKMAEKIGWSHQNSVQKPEKNQKIENPRFFHHYVLYEKTMF